MIRFAIIGTSMITDRFLEAGNEVKEFQLKGVYSRSLKKAMDYAKKHCAEVTFDNLEILSNSNEIDAVYIASPNYCHASQAIQMLKNKKHVLCEKPICSNIQEFEQMKSAALENKVVLLEAMRSVYSPGFHMIQDNLHKIGKIRRVSFQYCQYSSRYDNFKKGIIENAFHTELSNAALMDIGVYCVHPLVALFGSPVHIKSSSLKLSNGFEGAGTILLEYDGMQAELLYSKITNSKVPSQIQGEEGSIVIQEIANPQNVTIYFRNGKTEVLNIPQKENNMCYEIETFIKLIKEKDFCHNYLQNSYIELQIMDEVRQQQNIIFPADK